MRKNVMRGLDPRIHLSKRVMGHRIESGDDIVLADGLA